MYGCETWPLTLREVHRFKLFENSVLRRIYEPKRREGAFPMMEVTVIVLYTPAVIISHPSLFFSVALQSFRTLAALHIGSFLNYLDTW
jgi:hypothetical protein